MKQSQIDAGTIAALMIRLKETRIPRAKRMLDKVNDGQKLSDEGIAFLKRVYQDGRASRALVDRNPECQDLISRFVDLYSEIVTKALENETKA